MVTSIAMYYQLFNLGTQVKSFKFCFNTNNSIQHYLFVCAQLNGSKFCYVSLTIQLDSPFFFSTQLIVKEFYF